MKTLWFILFVYAVLWDLGLTAAVFLAGVGLLSHGYYQGLLLVVIWPAVCIAGLRLLAEPALDKYWSL